MDILRCTINNVDLVIEAINKIKKAEDLNTIEANTVTRFLNNDNNYFFVALDENNVVGYAIVYRQVSLDSLNDVMCLYDIKVLKKHRAKGIGELIINEIKKICESENILKLWMPTNIRNIPASILCKKTGAMAKELGNEVIYTYEFK
ncbi:Hypothetical protein CM240_2243 [Clostridium bornimense]|uniref:N-acetyltransferase domain-containing protein n=1 Tax=Clostridium bornimense TaxID=1216932 RepID=W6RXL9_9CLOT|nr:GNAT family N-acetyltransferase [Clostridium bornimense]CDM69386.1 Hypothetical protein CM240_2243 [Clostridium bornimense]